MGKHKIEWTDETWNPTTGCDKISSGCKFCYAEIMAKRLQAMGQPNYKDGFQVRLQPQMLQKPFEWKTPRTIFVNSMSDLFHEKIPAEYVGEVFSVMNQPISPLHPQYHRYQVLTKRTDRLVELAPDLTWTPNIWMGVSVENDYVRERIYDLVKTPAAIKFLSIEPMIGPLPNLDLRGIHWVIVGGESGPGARPMDPDWVRDVRDQCLEQDVGFFFKQWGGVNKKKAGRELDGRVWDEEPRQKGRSGAPIIIERKARRRWNGQ